MRRFGMIIGLKPETEERYIREHKAVWPDVLAQIKRSNIRNYTIFLKDHKLFAYFEYHGTNFEADMAAMANDEATKDWWTIMEPMQAPLPSRGKGEWWASMEEIFHVD